MTVDLVNFLFLNTYEFMNIFCIYECLLSCEMSDEVVIYLV
jgi:hypothetical protein